MFLTFLTVYHMPIVRRIPNNLQYTDFISENTFFVSMVYYKDFFDGSLSTGVAYQLFMGNNHSERFPNTKLFQCYSRSKSYPNRIINTKINQKIN